MAGAVSAVAADLIFRVPFVRNREDVGFRCHRLMERRIKDEHVTDFRQRFAERAVTNQMRRIVQRRQRCQFLNFIDDVRIDLDGLIEVCAALNNAVAGSGNLIQRFDDVIFNQSFQKQFDRDLVVLDRQVLGMFFPVDLDREDAFVQTDPFCHTGSQNFLLGHVEQLELKG